MLAREATAISPAPRFEAHARAWLRSAAVVDPDGAVRSWHNPNNPGFDYPEAAGLWLMAAGGSADPLADRVARRLAERVDKGEVGRDGVGYTFDLGVALAGLHAHVAAGGPAHAEARRRGEATLLQALAERRAVFAERAPRWSTSYGPHLLKLAIVLRQLRNARASAAAARLFDDLAGAHDRGRYLTDPGSGPTYVHAHCYAAEGLWCVAHGEDRSRADAARDRLALAADWLADVQRADGGFDRHHDGARACGPARTDATAQAVRIWAAVAPHRHRVSIARALAFIARCTTAEGAVRYEPDGADLNTWATIFSLQARRLAARPLATTTERPEAPW